ncbi:MAG: PAS domain S-box protein, partial [Deltaproteobacteria bacterium]|nr:PAS domain S-box protein [Deltaproteobacteria bacterium]
LITTVARKDHHGNAIGVQGTIRDVTDRKKAEDALRQSEVRYRTLVEESFDGIFVQRGIKIILANTRLHEMLGYEQGELVGCDHWVVYHPEYHAITRKRARARMRGEEVPSHYEVKLQRKDGSFLYGDINARAVTVDGEPGGQVWVRDITDRKLAEDALRESEEKYRSVVENCDERILVVQNGSVVFANRPAIETSGYSEAELTSRSFLELVHPEDRYTVMDRFVKRQRGEEPPGGYSFRGIDKSGNIRWFKASAVQIEWKGNPATLVFGTDITALKDAQESLRQQQETLNTILSSSPVGIAYAEKGKIRWANPAMSRMFGCQLEEEWVGQNVEQFYPSADEYQRVRDMVRKSIREGKPTELETRFRRRDGSVFDGIVRASPVDPSDPEKGTITAISDISAKKEAEQERNQLRDQLFQAQKMEALGTLTGGIAHDFNNLLTIINGYTELVLSEKTDDDPNYSDLQKILQTGRKGAELVQRLLAFIKKGVRGTPQPLDLNSVVENSVAVMKRTFRKMIEIETLLGKHLGMVNADPAQIEQVLMNLCINAKEAMPEGGKIRIGTKNVTVDKNYCRLHPEGKPGAYVLIEVSDTGTGMSKELMERMFDPFFTTKGWDFKKGTGLGLSVAKGIVEQHGGWLICESQPGKGTKFTIYLPAIEATPEYAKLEAGTAAIPGVNNILLVDDEEYVRDLAQTILERSGYTVLTASNGKDALDLYRRSREKISLVILDLIMPEMDGRQCLGELLKIDPNVRVLVASGFDANGPTKEAIETGARGFVGKPYNVRQMLQAVREVLDSE